MKRQLFPVIMLVLLCSASYLQSQVNLVPNPLFEIGNAPNSLGLVENCYNYFHLNGSPDYFKEPQLGSGTGIPNNFFGWQQDFMAGHAYLGFRGTSGTESIGCYLPSPLVQGHNYEVMVAISLANKSKYTCDGLGIRLGGTGFNFPDFISDTLNWTVILDTITAAFTDSLVRFGQMSGLFDMQEINPSGMDWAYYYVGAIFIKEVILTNFEDATEEEKGSWKTLGTFDILGVEAKSGLLIERRTSKSGKTEFRKIFKSTL